jgi:hypothetical protein
MTHQVVWKISMTEMILVIPEVRLIPPNREDNFTLFQESNE